MAGGRGSTLIPRSFSLSRSLCDLLGLTLSFGPSLSTPQHPVRHQDARGRPGDPCIPTPPPPQPPAPRPLSEAEGGGGGKLGSGQTYWTPENAQTPPPALVVRPPPQPQAFIPAPTSVAPRGSRPALDSQSHTSPTPSPDPRLRSHPHLGSDPSARVGPEPAQDGCPSWAWHTKFLLPPACGPRLHRWGVWRLS